MSNLDQLLKLVLAYGRNHRESLLQYFHHLGQRFHRISFVKSISSNMESRWSPLDHIITFENFMSFITYDFFYVTFIIYDILEISWLSIHKSYSKYNHLSIRCIGCLKSKHDTNKPY